MPITVLATEEEYNEFIKDKRLSVIHFFAPWADQCKQMNDCFEEMSKLSEFATCRFAKLVAEDMPQVTLKCEIVAVPTVLLYVNGNIIDRVDGTKPAVVTEKIKAILASEDSMPLMFQHPSRPEELLEAKLKRLINQAPCMLFMKGNPSTPRCGFSRTIVSLLDEAKVDYQTFDILEDNEVREGLKKFSNWPTYPQLYLKGDLIGGLDIVKEMNDAGDLEEMLPKKSNVNE